MQITRNTLDTRRGPGDWFTGAAWHTHPHGQTIWITEGIGLCRREGGAIEVIRPGDRVMTHIAIRQADETGSLVTWGDRVTDERYVQAPSATEGGN